MPDAFTLRRSEKLIEFYGQYRAELDSRPVGGRWMPYDWWSLPDTTEFCWFVYSNMLNEYARSLANIINDLTHHVHRIKAWENVIKQLSEEDKHELNHEFIDILGTISLGLPYAIKSRFAFAAGHLCHQANRVKDFDGWKDDFSDEKLYLNDIEPVCREWQKYRRFKLRVESISAKEFGKKTQDFRNRYNHSFSSQIIIGLNDLVKREKNKHGEVGYAIGGTPALDLGNIAAVLESERDKSYLAFDAFKILVAEQTDAIMDFEACRTGDNA